MCSFNIYSKENGYSFLKVNKFKSTVYLNSWSMVKNVSSSVLFFIFELG